LKAVDPGFDGVAVRANAGDAEFSAPAVATGGFHGNGLRLWLGFVPEEDAAGDPIVAIGEDFSFDDEAVCNNSLDRESAAVDLRPNTFDDHATRINLAVQRCLLSD